VAAEGLPLVAIRLKSCREAAGLSQQALATAADLSISVVSQIEQGARADPRVSTVVALARALKVSVDELVNKESSPSWGGRAPAGAKKTTRKGRKPKDNTGKGGAVH
jgi:transcriptional regulator with XRE-family HTH domain